jgi:hypothetical protein
MCLIKFLVISGDEMGEALCPYSVLDVAPLLQSKFAFVSGKILYI